jgi:alkylated DNA repair dioxygenase AlkB
LNYRYSGLDHSCCGWFDALLPIRDRLADVFGLHTNLALLNRYRDGSDHMGWHRDDERGHGPRVASLSLGATRRFLVRIPGEDRSRRIDLAAGSLLIMDGRLRHRLPPTRQSVDERINLTFRHIGSVAS